MVSCTAENTQRNREPWLAVGLSWLIPGCGQLYAGSYLWGGIFIILAGFFYIFWLASLMSAKCSIFTSLVIRLGSFIILSVLVCVDAFKLAKRANTDEFEVERTAGKDPWLAVFLSLLLPGLGHAYIRKWTLFGLYLLSFFMLGILYKHTVYAFIILPLFRVFVCIHAYMASPVLRKQNKNTIIMSAIFLMSVECLGGILVPWITTTYIVQGSNPSVGASMEPTLRDNNRIIINNIAYVWDAPEIGDIIALKVPENVKIPRNASKRARIALIKRVVAVGGETVQVKDDKVYVNGKERRFEITREFDENFDREKQKSDYVKVWGPYLKFGVDQPYRVPADCYFLLGDNLEYSADSRYFGAVPKEEIIGKVVKTYRPPMRMGRLY